mmetsp:Transcript_22213/g.36802  ORF Transcript_22213/g.36802 Transcript_22213/m.36802 type:complete len:82 (-) Transcript_22213:971-1216(-)
MLRVSIFTNNHQLRYLGRPWFRKATYVRELLDARKYLVQTQPQMLESLILASILPTDIGDCVLVNSPPSPYSCKRLSNRWY